LATGRGVNKDQARALACYRKAAHMGHAKSMNMLGRYLEEGVSCEQDLPAAHHWYRRSAEAGDFRGQFSHAAVLADQGDIQQSLHWLGTALRNGNLNFLRVSRQTLLSSPHPEIKRLAIDYFTKASAIGTAEDKAALSHFLKNAKTAA
ncbi:MAG: sel1 repeat family protein, partial [Pseudomonas sp.]